MKAGGVCPKCNGQMETGYTVDFGYFRVEPTAWVEGEPEPAVLSGVKVRGKTRYPVSSLRCCTCGYLELYAGPPSVPEATECLECETPLPPETSVCAVCGWTYEPEPA